MIVAAIAAEVVDYLNQLDDDWYVSRSTESTAVIVRKACTYTPTEPYDPNHKRMTPIVVSFNLNGASLATSGDVIRFNLDLNDPKTTTKKVAQIIFHRIPDHPRSHVPQTHSTTSTTYP